MIFILSVGEIRALDSRGDHWSPAKRHKETFLLVFFSLVRKERKGQKEESIPLLNSLCRLAATGANKVPRPSRYSITTATGSKRSSADSDLLLCHVRLWRTSRELTDSRKRTRSASPRQGQKVARFTATDEVLLQYIAETNPISLCSHPDPHHYFDHPVSATPTAFACANRSIPARFAIA